jgi:hypothetical protein
MRRNAFLAVRIDQTPTPFETPAIVFDTARRRAPRLDKASAFATIAVASSGRRTELPIMTACLGVALVLATSMKWPRFPAPLSVSAVTFGAILTGIALSSASQ